MSITFPAVENYPAFTIPSERRFSEMLKETPNIRFQHTIYGKVIDVGGDKPNIHIRPLGGGTEIICDCSEELAPEVAHLLYSVVGIVGGSHPKCSSDPHESDHSPAVPETDAQPVRRSERSRSWEIR